MSTFLDTIVKLVAMGALGAAIVCMLLGAALLHLVYKEPTPRNGHNAALTEKINGVKMFMFFTTGLFVLGLLFQLISSIVIPHVLVTYVMKPGMLPETLRNFQPTLMTIVDGVQNKVPAIENLVLHEQDKDVITFSYEGLVDHLKEIQKADTLAQAQTKEAGP